MIVKRGSSEESYNKNSGPKGDRSYKNYPEKGY
jgi:hypothetical protein